MPGRRTDLLSEAIDSLPRPARWLLRPSVAVLKLARAEALQGRLRRADDIGGPGAP